MSQVLSTITLAASLLVSAAHGVEPRAKLSSDSLTVAVDTKAPTPVPSNDLVKLDMLWPSSFALSGNERESRIGEGAQQGVMPSLSRHLAGTIASPPTPTGGEWPADRGGPDSSSEPAPSASSGQALSEAERARNDHRMRPQTRPRSALFLRFP